jgi:hypothetical protein
MRSLREHLQLLLESVNIFEGNFDGGDFTKDNYKYPKRVIPDLLSGKDIKLGNGTTISSSEINKIDKSIMSSLEDILQKINSGEAVTRVDFDDAFSKEAKMKLTGDANSIWLKIDKSIYSGKGGDKGQSAGEHAEPLVAYLYNLISENASNESLIDDIITYMNDREELVRIYNSMDNVVKSKFSESYAIDEEYLASSAKSVKLMIDIVKSIGGKKVSDYIACHSNCKDLVPKLVSSPNNIHELFVSNEKISSIFTNNKKKLSIITTEKNNWNPADIFLVERSVFKENLFIEELNDVKTNLNKLKDMYGISEDDTEIDNSVVNGKITSMILDGSIVPISLKKIGNKDGDGKVESHMKSNKEDKVSNSLSFLIKENDEYVFDVRIEEPKQPKPNEMNCSWYVKAKLKDNFKDKYPDYAGITYYIQFRLQTKDTVDKEKNQFGKIYMQLGTLNPGVQLKKVLSAFQVKYGEDGTYYTYNRERNGKYGESDNDNEMLKKLKDLFDRKIEDNKIKIAIGKSKSDDTFYNLSNRPATRGIIGTFNTFVNSKSTDVDEKLHEFIDTIWTICYDTSKYKSYWYVVAP